MKSPIGVFALALALSCAGAAAAHTAVLSGPLINVPESRGVFTWGDGVNDLFQQWSYRTSGSGWFYGSTYFYTSNADVFVYHGLANPTAITNAESFPYTDSSAAGVPGDTVFFRGMNGRYGAWAIAAIDVIALPPAPGPWSVLSGTWYFQTDGSGCFAASCGVTGTTQRTWGRIKQLYR
jgi:hypothetical protein